MGVFIFTTEFTEYHGVIYFWRMFLSPLERGQGGVLEYINMEFCSRFVDVSHTPPTSVVQSTELPSLSTDRHLVYPLKASLASLRGELRKTP